MKLEKYSVDQFAGMHDFDVTFQDGMNVVVGDNEAGKSTMISSIYNLLTAPSTLDKRKDKEFIERYFPTSGAETIDATLKFVADEKTYTIDKIWDKTGSESASKLKQMNGDVTRGSTADNILKGILKYGNAIYGNLVFGRQSYMPEILDWCFDFFNSKGEGVEEAKKKITEAFSVAGGVSEEKMLSLLEDEMNTMSGHWDFQKQEPERGRGISNKWVNGKGSILEAYYNYKDAEKELLDAEQIEVESANKNAQLVKYQQRKKELEDKLSKLQSQQAMIQNKSNIIQLCIVAKNKLDEQEKANSQWPKLSDNIEKAGRYARLLIENENRKLKDELLTNIKFLEEIEKDIQELKKRTEKYSGIVEDYKRADLISRDIERGVAKLGATKLSAEIKMHAPYIAELQFADGTSRRISESTSEKIDGYINIIIPEVGEFRIAPQELNVDEILTEADGKRRELNELLKIYGVDSIDDLSSLKESCQSDLNSLNTKQQILLGQNKSIDELQKEFDELVIDNTIVIPDTLQEDVSSLLAETKQDSLDACIAASKDRISYYMSTFESIDKLIESISESKQEIQKYDEQIASMTEVVSISMEEFETTVKSLTDEIENVDDQCTGLKTEIIRLQVSQKDYSEISEQKSDVERYEKEWELELKKYDNYLIIQSDLKKMSNETEDKLAEFNSKFDEYLNIITDNGIKLYSADNELNIKSGNNNISNKALLSEGTKKTVLLAFRLAVLDYFFPDGDGLIVLDDDLLDMDPSRRNKSAELLNRFAERNQVILTTCDPGIADLLGGNLIKI